MRQAAAAAGPVPPTPFAPVSPAPAPLVDIARLQQFILQSPEQLQNIFSAPQQLAAPRHAGPASSPAPRGRWVLTPLLCSTSLLSTPSSFYRQSLALSSLCSNHYHLAEGTSQSGTTQPGTNLSGTHIAAGTKPGIPGTDPPLLNLGSLLLLGSKSVRGLPGLITNPVPLETMIGLSLYQWIKDHLNYLLIAQLVQCQCLTVLDNSFQSRPKCCQIQLLPSSSSRLLDLLSSVLWSSCQIV